MYISSETSTDDDQSLVDCCCYCLYLIPTILQDRTIIVIIFESPRFFIYILSPNRSFSTTISYTFRNTTIIIYNISAGIVS